MVESLWKLSSNDRRNINRIAKCFVGCRTFFDNLKIVDWSSIPDQLDHVNDSVQIAKRIGAARIFTDDIEDENLREQLYHMFENYQLNDINGYPRTVSESCFCEELTDSDLWEQWIRNYEHSGLLFVCDNGD